MFSLSLHIFCFCFCFCCYALCYDLYFPIPCHLQKTFILLCVFAFFKFFCFHWSVYFSHFFLRLLCFALINNAITFRLIIIYVDLSQCWASHLNIAIYRVLPKYCCIWLESLVFFFFYNSYMKMKMYANFFFHSTLGCSVRKIHWMRDKWDFLFPFIRMIVINCHSTYLTNHQTLNFSKKLMVLSCAFIRFCSGRPTLYVSLHFLAAFDSFPVIFFLESIMINYYYYYQNGFVFWWRAAIHFKCLSPVACRLSFANCFRF